MVTMKPEMPLDLDDDLPSTSDYYLMFNSSLGVYQSFLDSSEFLNKIFKTLSYIPNLSVFVGVRRF